MFNGSYHYDSMLYTKNTFEHIFMLTWTLVKMLSRK
jgi:hypothetical protein